MTDKHEPLLDLDSRRNIFRHIQRNPGLHLRGLQRSLDIPLGTIEYHLHQMEKGGLIVSRDDGRFKAFFVKEGLDRRDKDILYFVRQDMPRQIVLQLLMSPGMSHSQLTATMPVSASTCSFHLKKLVGAKIVSEERVGRSKRFRIEEADRVAAVIVRYRRSFLDDLVDRFARAWLDVGHQTAAGVVEEEDDLEEAETKLIRDRRDPLTEELSSSDGSAEEDLLGPAPAAVQEDDERPPADPKRRPREGVSAPEGNDADGSAAADEGAEDAETAPKDLAGPGQTS